MKVYILVAVTYHFYLSLPIIFLLWKRVAYISKVFIILIVDDIKNDLNKLDDVTLSLNSMRQHALIVYIKTFPTMWPYRRHLLRNQCVVQSLKSKIFHLKSEVCELISVTPAWHSPSTAQEFTCKVFSTFLLSFIAYCEFIWTFYSKKSS